MCISLFLLPVLINGLRAHPKCMMIAMMDCGFLALSFELHYLC